jgi:hypothetical protein
MTPELSALLERLEESVRALPISRPDLNHMGREWSSYDAVLSQIVMETPTGKRRDDLSEIALVMAKMGHAFRALRILLEPETLPALAALRDAHKALEQAIWCGGIKLEPESTSPDEWDPGLEVTHEALIYSERDIQRAPDHPELTAVLKARTPSDDRVDTQGEPQ